MRLINSAADSVLNKSREILKVLYFRHLQNQKLRHEPSGTVLAGLVLFVAYGIHTTCLGRSAENRLLPVHRYMLYPLIALFLRLVSGVSHTAQ